MQTPRRVDLRLYMKGLEYRRKPMKKILSERAQKMVTLLLVFAVMLGFLPLYSQKEMVAAIEEEIPYYFWEVNRYEQGDNMSYSEEESGDAIYYEYGGAVFFLPEYDNNGDFIQWKQVSTYGEIYPNATVVVLENSLAGKVTFPESDNILDATYTITIENDEDYFELFEDNVSGFYCVKNNRKIYTVPEGDWSYSEGKSSVTLTLPIYCIYSPYYIYATHEYEGGTFFVSYRECAYSEAEQLLSDATAQGGYWTYTDEEGKERLVLDYREIAPGMELRGNGESILNLSLKYQYYNEPDYRVFWGTRGGKLSRDSSYLEDNTWTVEMQANANVISYFQENTVLFYFDDDDQKHELDYEIDESSFKITIKKIPYEVGAGSCTVFLTDEAIMGYPEPKEEELEDALGSYKIWIYDAEASHYYFYGTFDYKKYSLPVTENSFENIEAINLHDLCVDVSVTPIVLDNASIVSYAANNLTGNAWRDLGLPPYVYFASHDNELYLCINKSDLTEQDAIVLYQSGKNTKQKEIEYHYTLTEGDVLSPDVNHVISFLYENRKLVNVNDRGNSAQYTMSLIYADGHTETTGGIVATYRDSIYGQCQYILDLPDNASHGWKYMGNYTFTESGEEESLGMSTTMVDAIKVGDVLKSGENVLFDKMLNPESSEYADAKVTSMGILPGTNAGKVVFSIDGNAREDTLFVAEYSENAPIVEAPVSALNVLLAVPNNGHKYRISDIAKNGGEWIVSVTEEHVIGETEEIVETDSLGNPTKVIKKCVAQDHDEYKYYESKEMPFSPVQIGEETFTKEKMSNDVSEAIKGKMNLKQGATISTEIVEIILQESEDEIAWNMVSNDKFPETGWSFKVNYPAGTNKNDYVFTVMHLLTSDTSSGNAGEYETMDITLEDDGIVVKTYSMSPFTISYVKKADVIVPEAPKGTTPSSSTAKTAGSSTSVAEPAVEAQGVSNQGVTKQGVKAPQTGDSDFRRLIACAVSLLGSMMVSFIALYKWIRKRKDIR